MSERPFIFDDLLPDPDKPVPNWMREMMKVFFDANKKNQRVVVIRPGRWVRDDFVGRLLSGEEDR